MKAKKVHIYPFLSQDKGLVLCRIGRETVGTYGWDLERDTFQMGQWMRAKIYQCRCDLSPDGNYFIYFAYQPRWDNLANPHGRSQERLPPESWTAISRAPYLKAIDFIPWEKGGTWNGGGVFLDDTHVYINLMPDLWGTLDGKISPTGYHYVSQPKPEEYYGGEDLTPLLMRLRCHGWELDPDPNVGYLLTKKITNTLLLQKECLGREEEINKVCSLEGDTLLQVNGWCDYDTPRRRLVMADKCVLYAWALEDIERGRGYLASRKKLFSFQAARPLFSPAPYASLWERPCPHVVPPSC